MKSASYSSSQWWVGRLVATAGIIFAGSRALDAGPVVLNFDGGNGTAQVDQFTGVAGGGWGGPWTMQRNTGGGTISGTVISTSPLSAGGGNYLSADIANTRGMFTRQYNATTGSVNATQPHALQFQYRVDSLSAGFASGGRPVVVFDDNAARESTGGTNTWSVQVAGSGGTWDARGGSTGVPLVLGRTYDVTVMIRPAAQQYDLYVTDGTTSGYVLNSTFRTATSTLGRYLSFGDDTNGAAGGILGNSAQFSLDDVKLLPAAIVWSAAGGSWNESGAWSNVGPPSSSTDAAIDNGGNAAMRDSSGGGAIAQVRNLYLGATPGGSGAISWQGGNAVDLQVASHLVVGEDGTGTVTMTGPDAAGRTLSTNLLTVGRYGTGTLTLGDGILTTSNTVSVGDSGSAVGTVVQNGGLFTTNAQLDLGRLSATARGRYEIHGGTLTVAQFMQVGRLGIGEFLQTGGTVNVNRSGSPDPALMVGSSAGSVGTYTMSGGVLNVPNLETRVGSFGDGTFQLDAGTVNFGQLLAVGADGTSSGTFVQNGGDVSVGAQLDLARLSAASHGRYEMHGGTLTVAQFLQVGRMGPGEFVQTGGTVNVNRSGTPDPALMLGGAAGVVGTYTMSGGVLNVPTLAAAVGNNGIGTFDHSGGSVNIGANNSLIVGNLAGSSGTYNLSGTGVLTVGNDLIVGNAGDGRFIQTGGTVHNAVYNMGDVFIGNNAGVPGAYELRGSGVLNGDDIYVGYSGTGTFTMDAGAINTRTVLVARNPGSHGDFAMSGGAIVASGSISVGIESAGTLVQTGGAVQTAAATYVGERSGSNGLMRLGGTAQFATPDLFVGQNGTGVLEVEPGARLDVNRDAGTNFRVGNSGDGTVLQTGGAVTQPGNGAMYLGYEAAAVGRYTISGGTLDQGSLTIGGYNGGRGIFTQTGGDVFARRDVRLGRGPGGTGSYSLSGGTLAVTSQFGPGDLVAGFDGTGAGAFEQTGGLVDVDEHVILGNAAGNTGAYSISAGRLEIDNELRVGYDGRGTFLQFGGDVTTGDAVRLAVNSASSTGRYEMHGGTLDITGALNGYLQVGRVGTGTFVQTGGTVIVRRNAIAVSIGDKVGGRGTYEISGGTLRVTNNTLGVGVQGTGMLDVRGSHPLIETVGYSQNNLSTLRAAIDNQGVSRINVSGTASIASGALLDMDIYGGVALTDTRSFEVLRAATAGSVSGTFTQTDPEPALNWSLLQDGTVVQASITGPGLGTFTPGYGGPLREIEVNAGAGANVEYLTLQGVQPDAPLWVLLDVVDDQGDLDSGELADLVDYITSAGQSVTTSHPLLQGTRYDLFMDFQPTFTTGYFAWDFSDYNPSLLVTGVAVGVPEPSALLLCGLGLAGLLLGARRCRGKSRVR